MDREGHSAGYRTRPYDCTRVERLGPEGSRRLPHGLTLSRPPGLCACSTSPQVRKAGPRPRPQPPPSRQCFSLPSCCMSAGRSCSTASCVLPIVLSNQQHLHGLLGRRRSKGAGGGPLRAARSPMVGDGGELLSQSSLHTARVLRDGGDSAPPAPPGHGVREGR